MKISFTTLGCPGWDLDTICARASEYGFDGLDFRGLLDTLDITLLPAFTSGGAETKRKLADAGLEVCGISSSIQICAPEKRSDNIKEAQRTVAVAHVLGCQNIRVFGGGNPQAIGREKAADLGWECMEAILEIDGARDLRWLFETHDHWIESDHCQLLLERIPEPAFGVLWDMGHTPRVGGETPQETVAALGPRIGYTHVKDAVYDPGHALAMQDGWRYVVPGTGQLPLAEAIALLKETGYEGWIVFEHEKRWHPELLEPEEILPQFVQWVRGVIAS
jgi:sugar phosphate isomerase/epimerase